MKQELQTVLVQLLIAILPILSAFIIRLLNLKSNEIWRVTAAKATPATTANCSPRWKIHVVLYGDDMVLRYPTIASVEPQPVAE